MPYKCENIKLIELQDRRKKLTSAQRAKIIEIREKTGAGYGTIAKEFGVSKHTILRICNEKSRLRMIEYNKLHWKKYQQCKEERASVMREHRKHKNDLYKKGELPEPYLLFNERLAIANHYGIGINTVTDFAEAGLLNIVKCKKFALEIKIKNIKESKEL